MTLITGIERRRRWSREERAEILASADEPGAVVAEAARRADMCTSLAYNWRREAQSPATPPRFASVVVEQPASIPAPTVGLDAGVSRKHGSYIPRARERSAAGLIDCEDRQRHVRPALCIFKWAPLSRILCHPQTPSGCGRHTRRLGCKAAS